MPHKTYLEPDQCKLSRTGKSGFSLKYAINIIVIEHYCGPWESLFLFTTGKIQPDFKSTSIPKMYKMAYERFHFADLEV